MHFLRITTTMAISTLLCLATACGSDDDESGTGGAGGNGGMSGGGTGGMSGGGTGGMSGGGTGGMSGGSGGSAGGAGGTSGGADGGSSLEASTFCVDYETTCGFGADRFADKSDCETQFDGFSDGRQTCVVTHLGYADTDADLHCPHATGAAPCDQ